MVGILENSAQTHRTGPFVYRAADGVDAPRKVVHRPVAEPQSDIGHLLPGRFERAVLQNQVEHLAFGHREVGVDARVVRDGYQRLVDIAVHERPDTVGNHARHTVDGTLHLGVGEVVAGVCLRSPGLSQDRLGLELFVTCHLHVEIRHDRSRKSASLLFLVSRAVCNRASALVTLASAVSSAAR